MQSEEFDQYLNAMYERAYRQFRESGEGRLLRERSARCEEDCMLNFHPGDHIYITDLVAALADAEGAEAAYLYRRGYIDCMESLKQLHVL